MENNTIISNELEQMRSQISLLKDKLEKQNIINEKHIRKSITSKMSDISRTILISIVAGVFALVYCTWFFWHQGLSTLFVAGTAVMLIICVGLTIYQQIRLRSIDFSKDNLVRTAELLNRIKKHYRQWQWVAIPVVVLWIMWLIYEMVSTLGTETYVIGFCCGALVGGMIGGIIGLRVNRKVIRKTSEILEQIEELQNGE